MSSRELKAYALIVLGALLALAGAALTLPGFGALSIESHEHSIVTDIRGYPGGVFDLYGVYRRRHARRRADRDWPRGARALSLLVVADARVTARDRPAKEDGAAGEIRVDGPDARGCRQRPASCAEEARRISVHGQRPERPGHDHAPIRTARLSMGL